MNPRSHPKKKNKFVIYGLLVAIAIFIVAWIYKSSNSTAQASAQRKGTLDTSQFQIAASTHITAVAAPQPKQNKHSSSKCETPSSRTENNSRSRSDDSGAKINAHLAESSSTKTRAVGLLLTAISPKSLYCTEPECTESTAQSDTVRATAMDKLAEIGAMNPQGEEYVWATQACRLTTPTFKTPPHCGLVSIRRWSELHPDSVWPWLSLAAEANLKHDAAGEENYMAYALTATDWRNPAQTIVAIRALAVSDEDMESKIDTLANDAQITGYFTTSSVSTISRYCGPHPDVNRSQICIRLASNLASNADSILNLTIAANIAERSGASQEYVVGPAKFKSESMV